VTELWQALVNLFRVLGDLLGPMGTALLPLLVLVPWVAWWLWAVNWSKTWPVLARGGWVPVLLLALVVALIWSQVAPSDYRAFGVVLLPNFWWQLGAALLLVGIAFFCGWLQGVFGWQPPEIPVEPAPSHGHEHGYHSHEESHKEPKLSGI
jgi:hypothetical protein